MADVAEADFLYLPQATELTKGNLSSHLLKLEDAGYVTITKLFEGKTPRTICRLTAEGQAALGGYRRQMKDIIR